MKIHVAIVPSLNVKQGTLQIINNCGPLALVTACSKKIKLCLLEIIEKYLDTHDHQFGFKKQHSTDMCIFTLKIVIKYYTQQHTPVYLVSIFFRYRKTTLCRHSRCLSVRPL